jgi:hypothetical protein
MKSAQLCTEVINTGQNQLLTNIEASQLHPPVSSHPNKDAIEIANLVSANAHLLMPIGIVPGKKGDRVTQLLYENQNRLPAKASDNMRRTKVMGIIDEMEIDVYEFKEHKINTLHPENHYAGFRMLFNGGETLTWVIGGNNNHLGANLLG